MKYIIIVEYSPSILIHPSIFVFSANCIFYRFILFWIVQSLDMEVYSFQNTAFSGARVHVLRVFILTCIYI